MMQKQTYHQVLHQVARQRPDDLALCYKGPGVQKLTYRELDAYSTWAADYLAAAGCREGMFIPLLLNRGLDCVVWALGVIKTGAAALPLAENTPPARIQGIIKDAGGSFVLAHPDLAEKVTSCRCEIVQPGIWLQDEAAGHNSPPIGHGGTDNPMLVFFTSGSTGRPKGVILSHANVLGFARRHAEFSHIGPGVKTAAYSTVSFDAFVFDVIAPLAVGAEVHLIGETERISLVALHRYLMRHKIDFIFLTTRLGEEYMRSFDNPHLKRLATGGETLHFFTPRKYQVFNYYGPTETTVYVTAGPITRVAADYSLGRATAGMRIIILDEADSSCPPGQVGQICISGDQVALGYLNRPEETARAFTDNPQYKAGEDEPVYSRIYRTGDLGELDREGRLFFRGRMDHQVKIRGVRIEPGEVEAVLLELPQVRQAHVRPYTQENGSVHLAAYVSRSDRDSDAEAFLEGVKARLKEVLPIQMVPRFFKELDRLPLNANGKVDASALPEPTI